MNAISYLKMRKKSDAIIARKALILILSQENFIQINFYNSFFLKKRSIYTMVNFSLCLAIIIKLTSNFF